MNNRLRPDKTWSHPVIEYARNWGWKVQPIERFELDGAIIRRLVMRKPNLPTVKVMFKDNNLVAGTQHYMGQRLNPGRRPATKATVQRWLRA